MWLPVGCCCGQGDGSAESGQQPVRKRAAKQPRCLLLKEEGNCTEGAEPAASDVSCCHTGRSLGVSAQCPPSQAGLARWKGHKEPGETSRSLSPSKPSARQVMLLSNKIKTIKAPTKPFVKIGSTGS